MVKLGMFVRQTERESIESGIQFARELNLDAVDIHLSGIPKEPEGLLRLKMLCHKHGLPIGYLGSPGSLAGPEEGRQQRVEEAKAEVDTTAFLGAQLLRVFARYRWPDTVEEQEAIWAVLIPSFQEVADYAAKKGVIVALQNHDRSTFAMTAKQVLRILRDTNRPNFTFIMDAGQWLGAIGSDPRGEFDPNVDLYKDYLEPTAPYATCVRAKIYKIESGREEFLDYERIMKILRAANFNGNISIVFEGSKFNRCSREECLRLAVKHLREVIRAVFG